MCVVFWSQQGSFDIPYSIETLRYELPARRVLANVSSVISVPVGEEVRVGVAHRRCVHMEAAMGRWYACMEGQPDPIVHLLSQLYDCSFTPGEIPTANFDPKRIRGGVSKVALASETTGFELISVEHQDHSYQRLSEAQIPYTPCVFGPLNGGRDWLYSLDIVIGGSAFDILMDEETGCSVDGAGILKSRILNEDLPLLTGSPWRDFFEQTICAKIVKPNRYDVVITNTTGILPTCCRLCNRTRRELIADRSLAKKVAWFTSDDPDQDFIIELEFQDRVRTGTPPTYRPSH
jgi:hypothetical protein